MTDFPKQIIIATMAKDKPAKGWIGSILGGPPPMFLPPRCSPLLARRDDGEAALAASAASPSFSVPES